MTANPRWIFHGVILTFLAWQWVRTTIAAFSIPWRWSQDQVLFLLLPLGLAYVLGVWAFTWASGGSAAVKARWEKVRWPPELPKNKKILWMQMGFWIVVAIALVVIFNFARH
jgi:hypothetical protein